LRRSFFESHYRSAARKQNGKLLKKQDAEMRQARIQGKREARENETASNERLSSHMAMPPINQPPLFNPRTVTFNAATAGGVFRIVIPHALGHNDAAHTIFERQERSKPKLKWTAWPYLLGSG